MRALGHASSYCRARRAAALTMTFPGVANGSPLADITIYKTPKVAFSGPQPEDNIAPVTKPLAVAMGDMCDPM